MTPIKFPECNKVYGPPPDLEESQCFSIPAYEGEVIGGSVDGVKQVIVAWLPTDEDVDRIVAGEPIFLSMMGGLAPHFLTTSFEEARKPA